MAEELTEEEACCSRRQNSQSYTTRRTRFDDYLPSSGVRSVFVICDLDGKGRAIDLSVLHGRIDREIKIEADALILHIGFLLCWKKEKNRRLFRGKKTKRTGMERKKTQRQKR